MHTRTRAGGEKNRRGGELKKRKQDSAAVMEAAPSDGCLYSTDTYSGYLFLSLLPLSPCRRKSGRVGVRGVESGVGGGVGLLERVIFFFFFFFQRGERRTVMCAELMTKGPFMCSVCR